MLQRRNPLRLIINKKTQLRILWLVGGAVFFCMAATGILVTSKLQGVWMGALLIALGIFVSLWVSREIAGPLHRMERDLERILSGAVEKGPLQLRQQDPLRHLAELVNKMMKKYGKY